MKRKEKKILEGIYKDTLRLEKKKDLTEYGRGQGDLCIILLKKKRKPFKKRRKSKSDNKK